MAARSTAKKHRVPARRVRTADPPGARIVESFSAIGNLQLHRLNVPVDFMCATCRQHTHAWLAATVKGSWRLTVCESCYLTLIRDRTAVKLSNQGRQKPKRQGRTRVSMGQADEEVPAAPVVPRQRTTVAEPSSGVPRNDLPARTPRSAGAQQLLHFFWAAGVVSWTTADGDLYVRGKLAGRALSLAHSETDAWRRAVDRIAWRHAYDVLARAVANNACYSGSPEAIPLPQENGFAITCGRERIAVIHATHASVPGQPPVFGNFLAPGPHWGKVAPIVDGDTNATDLVDPLRLPSQPRVTSPGALGWRRVDRLPSNLDPVRADACMTASRRIRLERQLDYPCPVILESEGITLTLEPISGEDNSRHVPFRLRAGRRSVEGRFLLRRHGPDPLPLLISADVPDDDAIDAWVCALVGFADATCFEFPKPSLDRRVPCQRSSIVVHLPRPVLTPRRLPRAAPWPRHLKPMGYWSREENWVVAAHRRRLPKGQTASADALERARRAAIVLGPGQTWVKAHFCGPAHPAEVRFTWEPTANVAP
jgi:hypothetical protein